MTDTNENSTVATAENEHVASGPDLLRDPAASPANIQGLEQLAEPESTAPVTVESDGSVTQDSTAPQAQSALTPQPEPQKPAPEPKETPNVTTGGHALEVPQDGVLIPAVTAAETTVVGSDPATAPPPPPPVDNEHVAAGAEPFATAVPKPVLITPTVGRVVWYWPSLKAVNDGEQPRAAILTYVQDDHTVNLVSFGHDGFPLPHHGIRLLEVDEPAPASGHFACWMPFQAGQAKSAQSPGSPALAKA